MMIAETLTASTLSVGCIPHSLSKNDLVGWQVLWHNENNVTHSEGGIVCLFYYLIEFWCTDMIENVSKGNENSCPGVIHLRSVPRQFRDISACITISICVPLLVVSALSESAMSMLAYIDRKEREPVSLRGISI